MSPLPLGLDRRDQALYWAVGWSETRPGIVAAARAVKSGGGSGEAPFAVIDIGSNSVRLVVFDALRRHPTIVFNEKVLCGLGRMVGKIGRMDDAAMDCAIAACARFRLLAEAMGARHIEAVGTAAVREAANGPEFLARLKEDAGLGVRVLSGGEEAEASALGVACGIPGADGVVGDLGGGSLELVALERGQVTERATLPIGPVRLEGLFENDMPAVIRHVKAELKAVDWLDSIPSRSFYLVGGAWRAISRVMMAQEEAPLGILHGYCLDGERGRTLAKVISRQRADSLRGIEGVPNRRVPSLPTAALILHQVLRRLKPGQVVTSSLGLREGLVFSHLPAELRETHPLLEAARDVALQSGRFPEHADALAGWIAPALEGLPAAAEDAVLEQAACLLSDIAWRGHPDYRAEWAVTEVLYGRFVGIDHRGRGFLGLALNQLYGAAPTIPLATLCAGLLNDSEQKRARALGAALRLAQRVSGGTADLLARCRLQAQDGRLDLLVDAGFEMLVNEVVERRLASLAEILGAPGEIAFAAAE